MISFNSFGDHFSKISHLILNFHIDSLEQSFFLQTAQISTPALNIIDYLMSGIGLRACLYSHLLFLKQNWKKIQISVLPCRLVYIIFYSYNPQFTRFTNAVKTQRPCVQLLLKAVTILGTTWLANQCMLQSTSFLLKRYTEKWVALSCAFTIAAIHNLVIDLLSFTVNTGEQAGEQVKRETSLRMVPVQVMIALALSTKFLRAINPLYKNAVVIPLTKFVEQALEEHVKRNYNIH